MKERCRYGKSLEFGIGSWRKKKFFLLLASCFLLLASCRENKRENASNTSTGKDSLTYYCPMHPEIVQHHPGKCPKPECKGMALVLKTNEDLLEKVLKPVNGTVLASIKTTKPVFQKISLQVKANGYVGFDTRTMNNVSSLYSGRIEKLYVKYAYQKVNKGDILFEVYSPELVSAQQNLIYVLNNNPDEKTLVESARQKLILLGYGKNLIDELVNTKKVKMTVPVYNKYDGHVHPVMDLNASSEMIPVAIGKMENYQQNKELSIKEGMYIMAGQTVFNIVDPHKLAVILQIKSEDIPKVTKGLEVEMILEDNGMKMEGKIDFIDPFFKPGMKTMTAKVYIENSEHNHKVGSLVKATINGGKFEALWIPFSALVDLGKEKIVWIKENGNFIAKKVETGMIANGMIEIADGLTENSEIASEAHYLIDSEGFIKESQNE